MFVRNSAGRERERERVKTDAPAVTPVAPDAPTRAQTRPWRPDRTPGAVSVARAPHGAPSGRPPRPCSQAANPLSERAHPREQLTAHARAPPERVASRAVSRTTRVVAHPATRPRRRTRCCARGRGGAGRVRCWMCPLGTAPKIRLPPACSAPSHDAPRRARIGPPRRDHPTLGTTPPALSSAAS